MKKRCKDCLRPVCQRVLTLAGCAYKHMEEVIGEPINDYKMHDLVMG